MRALVRMRWERRQAATSAKRLAKEREGEGVREKHSPARLWSSQGYASVRIQKKKKKKKSGACEDVRACEVIQSSNENE